MDRPPILLSGAEPGEAAGNAVSSQLLLSILQSICDVTTLSHNVALLPHLSRERGPGNIECFRIGTLPLSVHSEGLIPGRLHRSILKCWPCGWAVNSRYAAALFAAGVPYAIWEATTIRDELLATSAIASRRAGRGSGVVAALHRVLLPQDERLERLLYKNAVLIFAMSEYTRDRILTLHKLAPSRVTVLPHPPGRSFLDAATRYEREAAIRHDSTALRRKADSNVVVSVNSSARLLFVGRVDDPRKNFGLLLTAFALLRTRGHAFSLTVIGPHSDTYRSSLAADVLPEGVVFRGRVTPDELVRAYADHDILVLPSRQEGFGIIVAEAMYLGLPVVSTRCGGPEAVIKSSGAGVLVDHDPEAIARVVGNLATDVQVLARMSDAGRHYARSELSMEKFRSRVTAATEELYRKAEGRSGIRANAHSF